MRNSIYSLACLALLGATTVSAQTLVVPGTAMWTSMSSEPFGKVNCRYQQILGVSDIKTGPATFKSMAFKAAPSGSAAAHKLDMQINFGYSIKAPSVMDAIYDNNSAGPIPTLVKRAQYSIPSLPASGFAIRFPLDKPFQYNGSSNLIFEILVHGNDNSNQPFYYDLELSRANSVSYVSTTLGTAAKSGSRYLGWGLATQLEYSSATFTPFGSGCKGENNYVPKISNLGLPKVGFLFKVYLGSVTGSRNAWLLMGKDNTKWGTVALPFDMTGLGLQNCKLYTDVIAILAAQTQGGTLGNGWAEKSLSIPAVALFVGSKIYFQWAVYAPNANPLNLAFSDGAEARIDL